MRLERWALRLQPYNLKVKYQPGETNAADYLSRYALTKTIRSTKNNEIEMYVNSIITDAIPKAMTLGEIQEATTKYSDLQLLIRSIQTGNWKQNKDKMMQYRKIRNELTVNEEANIVLIGRKIVI